MRYKTNELYKTISDHYFKVLECAVLYDDGSGLYKITYFGKDTGLSDYPEETHYHYISGKALDFQGAREASEVGPEIKEDLTLFEYLQADALYVDSDHKQDEVIRLISAYLESVKETV